MKPDIILVHGDSDNICCKLGSLYNQVRSGHVEAGFFEGPGRSIHPFPEEMNRQMTDAVNRSLFCSSTMRVKSKSRKENHDEEKHICYRNTAIDALKLTISRTLSSWYFSANSTKSSSHFRYYAPSWKSRRGGSRHCIYCTASGWSIWWCWGRLSLFILSPAVQSCIGNFE